MNYHSKWMALGLVAFGLLIALQYSGLTWLSARKLDDLAVEQSVLRVQEVLDRAQRVQVAVSEEYGWWNTLIEALERRDTDWLSGEFDENIQTRYGVTEVIALDTAYSPVYTQTHSTRSDTKALNGWDLARLRLIIDETQASSFEYPKSASDIFVKENAVYIVTAAALTRTDYPLSELESRERYTLLLMAPLTSAYLQKNSQALQVQDLLWSLERRPEKIELPILNKQGEIQGYLSWTLNSPGSLMASTIAWWSLPILLLSIIFGRMLLQWFQSLAEKSLESEIRSAALERSREYFQSLSDYAPVLIWQSDLHGNIIYGNGLFYDLWNRLTPGSVPRKMSEIRVEGLDDGLSELLERTKNSENSQQQEYLLDVEGESKCWLSVVGVAQRHSGEGVDGLVFSGIDVTDRKEAEQLIWKQANYDPLTGLANRSLFLDRLAQELLSSDRNDAEGGIMFVDLDNFKTINDSLGHSAGDHVLTEVAGRISSCLRTRDTVARFGGDEFVVLLPGTSEHSTIDEVAQRIRRELERDIQIGESAVVVTASMGVAYYPSDGADLDLLLSRADKAMYRAKQAGRNRIAFHEQAA